MKPPVLFSAALFLCSVGLSAEPFPDIRTVPADLTVPKVEMSAPAPGKRVFYRLPGAPEDSPAMVLYLPTDWVAGKSYPVIVELAGNGNFKSQYGDVSTGRPEGSNLGYGLSGGRGFIWACLPFLTDGGEDLAITWWGNAPEHRPDATVAYVKRAVPFLCEEFSGDASKVLLCGFSRGALACNAIGLHDEEIADLWRGFFCYSHYDGVREKWPYAGSDRASALTRLHRLGDRPQFLCQENSIAATRDYLQNTGVKGDFTFTETGFRNHNDAWTLRPSPVRAAAREWLFRILSDPSAAK
jgi:hypothetical protein